MTDVNETTTPAPEAEIAAKKVVAQVEANGDTEAEVQNGKHEATDDSALKDNGAEKKVVVGALDASADVAAEAAEKETDHFEAEVADEDDEEEEEEGAIVEEDDATNGEVEPQKNGRRKRDSDANGNEKVTGEASDEPTSKKVRTDESEVVAPEATAQ